MAYLRTSVLVVLIAVLSAAAVGQQQRAPADEPTPVAADDPQFVDLRVVDQGVEDRGGLSTSLRQFGPGLHQANDFAKVYQGPSGNDFMRIQGALRAVYPRSFSGVGMSIPPGTVFYIGEPSPFDVYMTPQDLTQPGSHPQQPVAGAADSLRWNTRLTGASPNQLGDRQDVYASAPLDSPRNGRRYDQPAGRPVDTSNDVRDAAKGPRVAPDIIADSDYRQRRLRELMQRAAQANQLRR